MKIWHDDLGMQDDRHEMRVELRFACDAGSVLARVTGGDAAVAAMDDLDWNVYATFFQTIRLLMLAGF